MRKNKILILGFIGILITGFAFYSTAEAADSSIYVSPASLNKTVGDTFDISVGVSPAEEKVCVTEGKLILNKLSCQSVKMGNEISAQTSPSCDDLSFVLGIQGCTANDKTLFTVTAKATSAGTGTANFTRIDLIGEGVSISSTSSNGSYTITSPCTCDTWSAWQNKACGGGNCSSTQRLQTHTRSCTPSSCDVEQESQCIDDSSCIPTSEAKKPSGEVAEEEKEETKKEKPKDEEKKEETKEKPKTQPEVKGVTKPKSDLPPKLSNETPENKTGLMANLAMAPGEITQSPFLTFVVILCLVSLVAVGVRKWWLFQKKRKK